MQVHTVHLGRGAARTAGGGDAVFVAEAFSRAAFLLGPIWLVWARAWAALALWLGAMGAIVAATVWFGLPPALIAGVWLAVATLTGLEAAELRRAALARRGYRPADVVCGQTLDDAERTFFRRAGLATVATADPRPAAAGPALAPVGGLFSDLGD
jgi:hypothetical protein